MRSRTSRSGWRTTAISSIGKDAKRPFRSPPQPAPTMPTNGSSWRARSAGIEMNALEAVELYRFFHTGADEIFALRGVSQQLRPGELLAVTGPSGSGKSTLLACLAGLDEPDGGYVELMGQRMTRRPEAERAALRARQIGCLRQSGNLFNH